MKKTNQEAEVVYEVETWKKDDFSTQLVQLKTPPPSLNSAGRIMFWHTMTMEAGKASIAAALMTAIELHKIKLAHPNEFVAWVENNLRHGDIKLGLTTVYKYINMLNKTVGKSVSIDELSQDSDKSKLEAVATFTKYTNYQSLYQLYYGEGIVKASNLGGSGRGQGRKRNDYNDAAVEELKKIATDPDEAQIAGDELLEKMKVWALNLGGFRAMKRDAQKAFVEKLTSFGNTLFDISNEKRK